jgi:Putative beta-barrel porin-2, OmpL-like. bbp2
MKKLLLTTAACLSFFGAFAINDPDKKEEAPKEKLSFSGYFDTYYFANFNNPKDRSNLGASGTARAFDQKSDQFSLGLVQTKAQYTTEHSDLVLDLAFGPNADLGQYGNVIGPLGKGTTSLAIKQAYFNWKASSKLTLTAGQFGTHIGYEVIDAPVNYHYSLSNLFNNGPFYHVGVKANYAFSDKVSLMAGLVNNVDNLNDNNGKKGLIAQLFVQPVSGWNVYVNTIASNEANEDITTGKTPDASYFMLDLTTTYQITEKFSLGLNAATGSQKGDYQGTGGPVTTKTWGGFAIYPKYDVSGKFSIGARYESFNNADGVRALRLADGTGVSVNSFTLTATVTTADSHLLLKPELRIDSYDKNFFVDGDGKATKSQATLGLAAIYKF